MCVASRAYTDGIGREGVGEEPNHTQRVRLNTLQYSNCVHHTPLKHFLVLSGIRKSSGAVWYLPQREKKDLEKGKAGNILPFYAV